MLGHITEVIFSCYDLDCLKEIEDFVLQNLDDYSKAEMKCIYTMFEVRNKMLFEDNLVRKKIYYDTDLH